VSKLHLTNFWVINIEILVKCETIKLWTNACSISVVSAVDSRLNGAFNCNPQPTGGVGSSSVNHKLSGVMCPTLHQARAPGGHLRRRGRRGAGQSDSSRQMLEFTEGQISIIQSSALKIQSDMNIQRIRKVR